MQKEFVKLSVDDIHPYPNNPRINDEAVAYVVESMNQTGNLDPHYCDVILQRWENLTGKKATRIKSAREE